MTSVFKAIGVFFLINGVIGCLGISMAFTAHTRGAPTMVWPLGMGILSVLYNGGWVLTAIVVIVLLIMGKFRPNDTQDESSWY